MFNEIEITFKTDRVVTFIGSIVEESSSSIFIETDVGWDVEINRDDVRMVVVKPL